MYIMESDDKNDKKLICATIKLTIVKYAEIAKVNQSVAIPFSE